MMAVIFFSACFFLFLGLGIMRPRGFPARDKFDSRRALFQLLAKLKLKSVLKMHLWERRRPPGPRK